MNSKLVKNNSQTKDCMAVNHVVPLSISRSESRLVSAGHHKNSKRVGKSSEAAATWDDDRIVGR